MLCCVVERASSVRAFAMYMSWGGYALYVFAKRAKRRRRLVVVRGVTRASALVQVVNDARAALPLLHWSAPHHPYLCTTSSFRVCLPCAQAW